MKFYPQRIKVDTKWIGNGKPCFVIAEAGSNHNRSLSLAKELINVAQEAGADAIKFQTIKFSELYLDRFSSRKTKKFIKSLELPEKWYPLLKEEAKKKGIIFLSSPTYIKAVDLLFGLGLNAFKIGSSQVVSDLALVAYAASKKLPLFISTGMADFRRIKRVLNICRKEGNDRVMLMHCVSLYPVPPQRVSLGRMLKLRDHFNTIVGLSDHALGKHFSIAAVSLGAKIIEKHFTLDRKMKGPDHHFSLEPKELKEMIRQIREIESGLPIANALSQEEIKTKGAVQLKWVADTDFSRGERLDRNSLVARRVPGGISIENNISYLSCARDISKGKVIKRNLISLRKFQR